MGRKGIGFINSERMGFFFEDGVIDGQVLRKDREEWRVRCSNMKEKENPNIWRYICQAT